MLTPQPPTRDERLHVVNTTEQHCNTRAPGVGWVLEPTQQICCALINATDQDPHPTDEIARAHDLIGARVEGRSVPTVRLSASLQCPAKCPDQTEHFLSRGVRLPFCGSLARRVSSLIQRTLHTDYSLTFAKA